MCSGCSHVLPFRSAVFSFSHMFSSFCKGVDSLISFCHACHGDRLLERFSESVWYCVRVYSLAGGTAIDMFLHFPTLFSIYLRVHMFSERIFVMNVISLSTLVWGMENLQPFESTIRPRNCICCVG